MLSDTLVAAAQRDSIEPAVLLTLVEVEASGLIFEGDGKTPQFLYERHIAWREAGKVSATPFPGHQLHLDWRRDDGSGNWYYASDLDLEGWLCPALLRYFSEAPKTIYVQVDPRPSQESSILESLNVIRRSSDCVFLAFSGANLRSLIVRILFKS